MRLHTHWLARLVTRCFGADAVTVGRDIFLSPTAVRSIAARTEPGARLIAHEIQHVSQFAREGFLSFGIRYLAAYARGRFRGLRHDAAYSQIPFEIEARDAEESAMWKAGLAVKEQPASAVDPWVRPRPAIKESAAAAVRASDVQTDEPDAEG
ncbi:MAG: DUF4157 domain-containing protein [Acidobacteriota bacterium]